MNQFWIRAMAILQRPLSIILSGQLVHIHRLSPSSCPLLYPTWLRKQLNHIHMATSRGVSQRCLIRKVFWRNINSPSCKEQLRNTHIAFLAAFSNGVRFQMSLSQDPQPRWQEASVQRLYSWSQSHKIILFGFMSLSKSGSIVFAARSSRISS